MWSLQIEFCLPAAAWIVCWPSSGLLTGMVSPLNPVDWSHLFKVFKRSASASGLFWWFLGINDQRNSWRSGFFPLSGSPGPSNTGSKRAICHWILNFGLFSVPLWKKPERLLLITGDKRQIWQEGMNDDFFQTISIIHWKLFSPYCFLLPAFNPDSLFFFFKEPFKLARVRISGLQAGWILPGLVCLFWVWESDEEIFQNNLRSTRLSSWNFWRLFGSITGLSGFDLWIIEKRCLAWIP